MPRQAVKGTLIIVSNRERAVFESQLSALKPQYLIWTSPDTPRDQIEMPPAGLAMVVFLIQTSPEGVTIDPSWGQDLPVSASEISKAGMMIAAKTIHPPGNAVPKWYASMAISAPNEKLLRVNFAEAMRLEDFPLNKPIVRDVLDLRRFRSIACLPLQTEGYYGPINTAAEAALYRALVDLRVFNVVGRESLSLPAPGGSVAGARARDLGRELNVDALAYVDITGAETNCEERIRYKKSSKTAVSTTRQREFEREKAEAEAKGRTYSRKSPSPDLVWAAPYRIRTFTTTVEGSVRIIDARDGAEVLVFDISDETASREEDAVRSIDYRWYPRDEIDEEDADLIQTYTCRLAVAEATELVRAEIDRFRVFLDTRAMLPIPGEDFEPQYPPVPGADTVARVISIDGPDVFIDLGREHSLKLGDSLSLWIDKELTDPETGEVIETIKTRAATVQVVEVYQRTSRCEIVRASDKTPLAVGMELVLD
ncbi:MAG: FlgT C-terminal domain-containing protein [Acidobacteriota bacterium]|nr:FlgT C-terminal domain-containing protein [Acidobacteriota bacterium]